MRMTPRKKQNASKALAKGLDTLLNHKSPKKKSGWGDEPEASEPEPSTPDPEVVVQRAKITPLDVAAGERTRITHALNLMEAMIQSMRIALLDAAPIGMECPQALLTTAGNIVAHAAAADAALRLKDG